MEWRFHLVRRRQYTYKRRKIVTKYKSRREVPNEYSSMSSRIKTLRFNTVAFKVIIVRTYVPTASYSDEDIEVFCNSVNDTLAKRIKKA